MSNQVTGVVQQVVSKSVSGGKTAYDITVAGKSYGYGLYPPKAKEGDYVKFDVDDSRGYPNVARNSMKVSANKAPAEAMAEAQSTAPKKSSTGGSFDSKQETISRQSALNSAIAFMQVLSANDALGLPAATAKGKRQEALESMLAKYTQELYESNTGVKWTDITPTAASKAAAPADEEDVEEAPADSEWK